MSVSVVVADDQELVRDGLALVLASAPGIQVVGVAADGAEALALVRAHRPDVVLLDIRMPGTDGLTALPAILAEFPAVRVLMLTTYDVDEYVLEALRGGAAGYLLKDVPRDGLTAAVLAAAAGDTLLDPSVARRLAGAPPPRTPPDLARATGRLTPRERDILAEVAQGWSNREIAERLFLSEATVKTHVAHVLEKLSARDRVQLAVWVHTYGLVELGP